MEVTMAQIAEIFYRVKDAWFTSGQYNGINDYLPSYIASYKIEASTTAPSNRVEWLYASSVFQNRGYHANADDINPLAESYLEAEYDDGSGSMFREINDKEMGMWLPLPDTYSYPHWNGLSWLSVNAFSMFQTNGGTDAVATSDYFKAEYLDYFDTGITGAGVRVLFNGEVAWLDLNGSGNPFDPLNKLYLNVEFGAYMLFNGGYLSPYIGNSESYSLNTLLPYYEICTNTNLLDTVIGSSYEICRYIIKLGNSEASCPIYATQPWGALNCYDFIHEAKLYFPYQDGNGDVWNPATGLEA
jgi:hypothetical protein